MKRKDIILIIGVIAFLALILSLSLLLGNQLKPHACGCPHVISHNFIWLFIVLAVVFAGSLLYYLLSIKIDNQTKIMDKNVEVLYLILDEDEKKVLRKLIDNKGVMMQSKLSETFGKIKSHRLIKKLISKKIVEVKKNGKSNLVKLNRELKEELL